MALSSISDFTSSLILDGARPNLFDVTLNGPFDNTLQFKAKAASLPGSTIGVVEVPYMGRMIKYAGNRTFPEWTMTVINDEDFLVRDQLEAWMNDQINMHNANLQNSTMNGGYAFEGTVYQYGKDGGMIKQYNFVNMWPSDIAPIDLDWGSNDTIEEYQVTFAYQYWTSNTSDA